MISKNCAYILENDKKVGNYYIKVEKNIAIVRAAKNLCTYFMDAPSINYSGVSITIIQK